ncbi:MAG: glycosyltransferase family 1 protein [Phototrophicales bacterium]
MIAIDYTPACEQRAGIGRYVRELIRALMQIDHETPYRLFVSGAKKNLPPLPHNFIWKPTRLSPKTLARVWHRLHIPLPVEFFTGKIKLYHATDFVLPPIWAESILTVHDLSFIKVPEAASPSLKRYLDSVVPRSIRHATHILADSQATKDDIVNIYGTSPQKITVLYSGVDSYFKPSLERTQEIRRRYGIPAGQPYIFSIGTVQPRKNYVRLIEALKLLHQRGYDISLVIAGGKGWLDNPIYATIKSSGVQDYVQMIGYADDQDLPGLYSDAICTAFPSLYEGFGLPILESMACGTPVLTSDVSSLPEVAGDAAIIVNPYDLDDITHGLEKLITDTQLRNQLIIKGYERVKSFTWENAAYQLANIYQRMIR